MWPSPSPFATCIYIAQTRDIRNLSTQSFTSCVVLHKKTAKLVRDDGKQRLRIRSIPVEEAMFSCKS
jgi:hypothetical protein